MEIDDFGNLCMGCMKDKGDSLECPVCGYRPDHRRSPFVLPYQAILNNKFLVGRILGKPGGFGVTYLAWDLVLHITVAIKEYLPRDLVARDPNHLTVVPHSQDANEEFSYGLRQFLREARTLSKFNHPNVVRVREFFEQNRTGYITMDYYEGISLDEYIKRNGGKLDEATVMAIMLPVMDGLREVHAQGFLHRDIKPENIYLTKGGNPILLDFGAARLALWGQLSRPLSVVLTPGFAPFEQYLEQQEFGPPTDIYGIGATLYFLATGQKPQEATGRYRKDGVVSPDSLVPELSSCFSQAVMRALALEPEQRPQTIDELRHLLVAESASPAMHVPGAAGNTEASDGFDAVTVTRRPQKLAATTVKSDQAAPPRKSPPPVRVQARGLPFWLWGLLGGLVLVMGLILSTWSAYFRAPPTSPAYAEPVDSAVYQPPAVPAPPVVPGFSELETQIDPPTPQAEPTIQPEPGPPRSRAGVPPPYPPPRDAIDACRGKSVGAACRLLGWEGRPAGACQQIHAYFACVPEGLPPPRQR